MDYASIKKTAMNLLARREHARAELHEKLQIRFAQHDIINQVLDVLATESLQSDERFAESYVRYRKERGYGPVKISLELKERGISLELIERFIDYNDPFWWQQVHRLRERRYGSKQNSELEYKEKAKQVRFFVQRGFTKEQIVSLPDD